LNETESIACDATENMPTNIGEKLLSSITKKGIIYKLTSPVNKIYVGQTIQKPENRWNKYKMLKCKDQAHLYRALIKYGFDSFKKEIIEECDISDLDQRETYWIIVFNSVEDGYNLTYGGDSRELSTESLLKLKNSLNEYWKDNQQARSKASNFSIDYWNNPVSHKRQSDLARKLWEDPIYRNHHVAVRIGRKHSADHLAKQRKCMLGKNPKLTDYTEEERSIIKSIHRRQIYTEEEKKILKEFRLAAKSRISSSS
jgi:group I intron endonuclease